MRRVGLRFFSFRLSWIGSTIAKLVKVREAYVNAFKARLGKTWLHQAAKFDFAADLIDTGNRT